VQADSSKLKAQSWRLKAESSKFVDNVDFNGAGCVVRDLKIGVWFSAFGAGMRAKKWS